MRQTEKLTPSSPRLNTYFKVVFQPKQPELFGNKRRFAVGLYSLHKYIGEKNANTAILSALSGYDDTYQQKFRKWGTVKFYNK